MAILLQSLSARLGIVAGQDLAQACRDTYSKPLNFTLWILCEVAVAACDLAEVIGTVIGLNLLFGLPPLVGLVLTGLDTFLFLAIQRLGVRKLEAFILALIATVGACFVPKDNATLRHAASLAQSHGAELVLIHVVEGLGGRIHGSDAADDERRADEAYLQQLQSTLADDGLTGFTVLCFGNPARQIVRAVKDERLDLLVLGSHGHGWFADWLFGETIRKVRHAVSIPVLVVRESTPRRPK